ncbi:MAG: hypothetical protein ACK4V2_04395 [Pseudomonadota bacterium]|jgi:hypothetical protein|nr:hypothetical protein [Alphaproteobacteria bacterium]
MVNIYEPFLRFLLISWLLFPLIKAMDTEDIKKRSVPPPSPRSVVFYSVFDPSSEEISTLEIPQTTQDHKEQEESASDKPSVFNTTPLTSISFNALSYFLIIPRNAKYLGISTPLFRNTSSDSPDLLDLPRCLFSEGGTTLHLKHGTVYSIPTVSSSKALGIAIQDQTLFVSISQHPSKDIRRYVEEKDLGIFLLLDDTYLRKQLLYMQPSNPLLNEAIKVFTSHTHVQLDEMLGVVSTQSESDLPQMTGLASIEQVREVTYTGVDNLLFAKAYTHMINILQKVLLISEQHINPNAPSIAAVRQLFCTKKPYLMAMIAFLTTCHQVAASEEQKQISKSLDLPTEELPSSTPLIGITNAQEIAFPATSLAGPPREDDTPMDELFRILGVANQEEFFALENDEFIRKVKESISSRQNSNRLVKLYSHHQVQIRKQQRQEEALKRAAERNARADDFYKNAVITDIVRDSYGHILFARVGPPEEKDSK